ncbi:MAG: ABC-type amino acid transport substrate-binding protein [Desulforhopalus sp.]|jgi:ABC-type amino acid transport substrate-binding protein
MNRSLFRPVVHLTLCVLSLVLALGCTPIVQNNQTGNTASNSLAPLRVGVSTNMPPLVYKSGGRLQGLEIDFARQLGQHLNREVKFVEQSWDKQIPSLEAGKIDIIMSGMTITPKRAYRVSFAQPYMHSGQILLVRMNQARLYSSGIYSLMGNKPKIGIIKNTTGDYFITKTINRADITRYSASEKAVAALINGEIDVFVHDAPVICYFAAKNEQARLTPILKLSNEEQLAWAVNKMDQKLLGEVNSFMTTASGNQVLHNTIKRWIPYMDQ